MNTKKQINLYETDFNFFSQWEEVCQQLNVNPNKVSGVTITYTEIEIEEENILEKELV
jgi:hypothetical protein